MKPTETSAKGQTTISLSFYWSDELGEIIKARSLEPYPIECHKGSMGLAALSEAINQGIDSHLEAIRFVLSQGEHGRVRLVFEPDSMPVLVRRLMESQEEHAESLASSICGTLDIELV